MKINLVLLAAGFSRRFGQKNKLLMDIEQKPMVWYALLNAQKVKEQLPDVMGDVMIVSKYVEIRDLCSHEFSQIKYVNNPESSRGITSSIHLGLKNSSEKSGILFLVCDQPYLKADTICELILGFIDSGKTMACLTDKEGEKSNPCIFAPKWRKSLFMLSGDRGGKKLLLEHEEEVYCHMVKNEKELEDIDRIC